MKLSIRNIRTMYHKQFHDTKILEGTSITYSERYVIIKDSNNRQLFAIDHQKKEILYDCGITLITLMGEKTPNFKFTPENIERINDVSDLIGHVMNHMYKLPNYTPTPYA